MRGRSAGVGKGPSSLQGGRGRAGSCTGQREDPTGKTVSPGKGCGGGEMGMETGGTTGVQSDGGSEPDRETRPECRGQAG